MPNEDGACLGGTGEHRSADRRGRTSHYAAGLGIFCVGSVFAGLAPGMWWLFAGRCCQGLGGALIVTTSAALAAQTVAPPLSVVEP